jgi:hypothetical protein
VSFDSAPERAQPALGGVEIRPPIRFRHLRLCALLCGALVATACTTVLVRNPAPEASLEMARPYGIQNRLVRAWGDELGEEAVEYLIENRIAALRVARAADIRQGRPIRSDVLALSGGGADGAFGAGLLAGWTERGDRPEFSIVSGVSTGAIIALFAFLGPDYDAALRDIYTNYGTRDLLTPAILSGLLRGAAVTDTSGFRRLIEKYVDDGLVRRVAEEHRRGRLLLIGTTNLDATRPVVWNIGEIATTGHPDATRLIRDVIEASAAIPGAFPPVLIPVEANGRWFDEMHVDGGATRQVQLFSPEVRQRRIDEALGVPFDRRLYVIINNRLRRPYAPVAPRVRPITAAAISSLIAGAGAGDVVQLYAVASLEDVTVGILSIPTAFERVAEEPFDRGYMSELYAFGYEMGRNGAPWLSRPPGFPDSFEERAQTSPVAAGR